MMRTEKRKSATVCLAAAVLLTCCLVLTTDCYQLKKTERRNNADAATGIGVQEGTIVFGKAFQRGSGLESHAIDGTRRASSNDSVEDEAAYQADQAAFMPFYMPSATSKEAEFQNLYPKVQCLKDQMKFRAVGNTASHFLLDQGGRSIPLSQVPSSCGYSMHKNSMALVLLVPYNGCHMVQQGGNYVLPMRWQGIPVSLLCPKPGPTTPAPQYTVPQTTAPPLANPDVPNIPKLPPIYFFGPPHPYPKYPAMPIYPDMPKFPFPHVPPYLPYLPPPPQTTTAAPTTTTKPSTTSGQQMIYPPHIHPLHLYSNVGPPFQWPLPEHLPIVSHPAVITKPGPKPQFLPYPHYFPLHPLPPFLHPPQFPQHPTKTAAPADAIVTPLHSHIDPHHHSLGFPHHRFGPPHHYQLDPSHQQPPDQTMQIMQYPIPKV